MKYIYLLSLVFFISCNKQDEVPKVFKQVCDQETTAELTIHNYAEYSNFEKAVFDGDIIYYCYYQQTLKDFIPINAQWLIEISLQNVCNADLPQLEFSILLHHPDTTLKIGRSIDDYPNSNISAPLYPTIDGLLNISADGTHFNLNEIYNLTNIDTGSSIILTALYIVIPSLGTYNLDSAYFFSNLDYMSCTIKAHKPQ